MRDARGEGVEMRAVAAFQLSVGEPSLILSCVNSSQKAEFIHFVAAATSQVACESFQRPKLL